MSKQVSSIVGTVVGTGPSSQISTAAAAWVQSERRISVQTLEALGVASGTAFFPDLGVKAPAVFFKYPEGWKARSYPEKSFVAGGGFKLSFWNIDRVLAAKPETVYIVEGEFDACALVEAGVDPSQVLSVPAGAREKPADDPKAQKGYDYVLNALTAGLSQVNRFIWCGDADGNGHALRADMVRILGAARFCFVDWPEPIKDANAFLKTDGPLPLFDLVTAGYLPWPVDGLYLLRELPEPAPLVLWMPGFPEWESKVMLAPRTLSIVTGHPGHGKTALWQQIWFQVAKAYGVRICMASFETRPKPHLRKQLRTLFSGALEKNMSDADKANADDFINDHYHFLVHPEQRPTLEWLLERAEVAVIRHGARVISIDPWNRMEGQRQSNETETDYIGRCLREMHAFAHDMNIHMQVLAHPAKMDNMRRGKPPGLEDISGSKNWENMCDQGFVVHRPEMFDGTNRKTEAELFCRKARFEELGYPCRLKLDFKIEKGRYVSTDYDRTGGK
jgi:twinkle protein